MTDRALLEDLRAVVKSGFAEMRIDIQLVSTDVQVIKDRVVILEKWKLENEERVSRHSGGTKQLSQDNLKQDAAIAMLHTKTDQQSVEIAETKSLVEKNNAMTARIEKAATDVLSSPRVKALSWALWLALAGWLASKGITVPK